MAKIKFIRLPGLPKTPIGDDQGSGALTPEQEAAISANTAARHTHQNKSVLDSITAGKTAAWDAKANASDIPSLTGYATETWVEGKGYQTAQDVQTAIAGVRQLPTVSANDNGKTLVVDNGAWNKGYQAARTPRVAMTASDTTPTIDPNKLYVFPEMASLAPVLASPSDNSIANEYHFCFDSGATATVLTLPATVLQPDGFTVEANMHYEISILEGAMTAQGWAVSA